jgi:hypothetical protein
MWVGLTLQSPWKKSILQFDLEGAAAAHPPLVRHAANTGGQYNRRRWCTSIVLLLKEFISFVLHC